MFALLCAAVLGWSAPEPARQAPAPAAQPPLPAAGAKDAPAPLAGGAWPAGSTEEARAAWRSLVAALKPAKAEAAAAITAFDLFITTRVATRAEGGGLEQNDVKVRYRHLAPNFVHTTLLETKVESMRGPEGDWLWDPEKNDLVHLAGKDFEQDRKGLSQTLSVARNFLALAEPQLLRISALSKLPGPPALVPRAKSGGAPFPKESSLARAAELVWISIDSPDFQVVEPKPSKAPPMFKVQLGLDPASFLPLVALIWQDEQGAMVAETAVLVDLLATQFRPLDERKVPRYFSVYDPLLPSSPLRFQDEPRVTVSVDSRSTLRPALAPKDFCPPKRSK